MPDIIPTVNCNLQWRQRQIVYAKQGDYGARKVKIFLFNGSNSYSVPASGLSAVFAYKRPDGFVDSYDTIDGASAISLSSADDCATVTLAQQVLAVPGLVECELQLLTANSLTATFTFYISVEASVVPGAEPSEQTTNPFVHTLADLGGGYTMCSTAAATQAKTAIIPGFHPVDGCTFCIRFVNPVPAGATLQIGRGVDDYPYDAVDIYFRNAPITGGVIQADDIVTFVYDEATETYRITSIDATIVHLADAGCGYAVCSTAAATAAKTATINGYRLVNGGRVSIKFSNAVPANATLNISSTGAKDIYYHGSKVTGSLIGAGDLVTFVYDSTNSRYLVASIDAAGSGGANVDNVVYVPFTLDGNAYKANITPEIIYNAIVRDGQNIMYCLVDPVTHSAAKMKNVPTSTSDTVYFEDISEVNHNIILYSLASNGVVTWNSTPFITSNPTWASIKPPGGVLDSDLAVYETTISASSSGWMANHSFSDILDAHNAEKQLRFQYGDIHLRVDELTGTYVALSCIDASTPSAPVLLTFVITATGVAGSSQPIGNANEPTEVTVTGNTPSISAPADNAVYQCTGSAITSLTIADYAYGNAFTVIFNTQPSPASVPTVTIDSKIQLPDNFQFEVNKHYEINVDEFGYAVVGSWVLVD